MVLNILRTDMDISIKISVSQSIIIAKSAKKHSLSQSRSGKQPRLFTLCYCLANSQTTLTR